MPISNPPSFKDNLREHQRKLTRSRQTVLDVITQADHHLTTAEVYRKAKAKYKRIGLTTVYRTLDLLVELGYIVYAPQNPYIGKDDFRVLQRKANPLGLSLFSFIIRQHERTVDWL